MSKDQVIDLQQSIQRDSGQVHEIQQRIKDLDAGADNKRNQI